MSEYTGPRRGDEVEAWIKRNRDKYHDDGWWAIDNLLDDYRLHADTGASLDVEASELQGHWSEIQQPLVETMYPVTVCLRLDAA